MQGNRKNPCVKSYGKYPDGRRNCCLNEQQAVFIVMRLKHPEISITELNKQMPALTALFKAEFEKALRQ